MKTFVTIHAVAKNREGKYLILQRAKERSYPGTWNHVTGYIQDRESAEEAALRELFEETNLTGKVLDSTKPFWADFGKTRWVVITVLIQVKNERKIEIDKNESENYDWIYLNDKRIKEFDAMRASFEKLGLL